MVYFFILYSVLLVYLSLLGSYKKGLLAYWISLLLVPTVIMNQTVLSYAYFRTTSIMLVTGFALQDRECREEIGRLISDNKVVFLAVAGVSAAILLLSDTVPLSTQLWNFFQKIWTYPAIFLTFFAVRNDRVFARQLFVCIACCLLLNAFYCLCFEIILRYNPSGTPLYTFLGNTRAVDAINFSRGLLGFRLQSVFGHPLSLGQYLLVLYPLFLACNRIYDSLLCKAVVYTVPVVIFLTGTRGAYIPLLLLLFYHLYKSTVSVRQFIWGTGIVGAASLACLLLPANTEKQINRSVEMFVNSLRVWDSSKQKAFTKKSGASSLEGRIKQFDAALEELASNPLTGRGIGYREWYQDKYHLRTHPRLLGYESIALLYPVERGFLGFICYIGIVFGLYLYFVRRTCARRYVLFIFGSFLLSGFLTGERILSLQFSGLCASLLCSFFPNYRSI